jgi:hypothetical protein
MPGLGIRQRSSSLGDPGRALVDAADGGHLLWRFAGMPVSLVVWPPVGAGSRHGSAVADRRGTGVPRTSTTIRAVPPKSGADEAVRSRSFPAERGRKPTNRRRAGADATDPRAAAPAHGRLLTRVLADPAGRRRRMALRADGDRSLQMLGTAPARLSRRP